MKKKQTKKPKTSQARACAKPTSIKEMMKAEGEEKAKEFFWLCAGIDSLEEEGCFVHDEANLLHAAVSYIVAGGEEFWLTHLASRCAHNALHKLELGHFGKPEEVKELLNAATELCELLDF